MRRILLVMLALGLLAPLAPSASADDFHIVNGQEAPQGAYPWMAAFLFDGGQGCGGSVIAPNWILTASHCVADDRGQPSVTPGQATFRVNTNNWTDGNGETLTAAEIFIHPSYDAATTNNDVALVRTNEAATVTPVRIAGLDDIAQWQPGANLRVIGYGTTSSGGDSSDVLLEVDVPVVSDADCAEGYGNLVAQNMLCAGDPAEDEADPPGRDSCQGDSGGPLFVPGPDPLQVGVVSFGIGCGFPLPGVYAEVATYAEWINGVVGGDLGQGAPDPGPVAEQPTGAESQVVRIAGTNPDSPVDNAIAMSQTVFQTPGEFGVLAASANFPDALGGSALASYYGPLLYVGPDGTLGGATLTEFQRALEPGSTIYILGGTAAVDASVDGQLAAAGFNPVRLAGAGRQQTARLVAQEVRNVVNEGEDPPFNAVIIAFEGNWPDAVAVGSISAWFGIPVLLTPTDSLGGPAAEYLQTYQPEQVMVLGGTAVISDATRAEIDAIIEPNGGFIQPLFGATRLETAADIAFYTDFLFESNEDVFEFEGEALVDPDLLVAVNLRRDDAFAHVLAASQIVGNFGGLFVPLEGDGSQLDPAVVPAICGLDLQVFAIGGPGLVTDGAAQQIQAASAGEGCEPGEFR